MIDKFGVEDSKITTIAELLPALDDALEDLELHGRHSDQGYRKLKDWYRLMAIATDTVQPADVLLEALEQSLRAGRGIIVGASDEAELLSAIAAYKAAKKCRKGKVIRK